MVNLVKKDLRLSFKVNIFAVLYALFISAGGLVRDDVVLANLLYTLGILILTFITVIYTNGYDDKYKSEIVLNSFPIDRRDIVRAKYLTLMIFILLFSGTILVFTNVLPVIIFIEGAVGASIHTAILAINILLIFYSLYYPVYFKVGEGLRSFNTILWLLLLIAPASMKRGVEFLAKRGLLEKLAQVDLSRINLYLLGISLIIYYISLQISKKIYMGREF